MFLIASYKFKKGRYKGDSLKAMIGDTPNNQDLPLLAAMFTSILCIGFGANAVAIKISLSGLGAFTTAGLRFSIATLAIFLWARTTRRSFIIKKGQAHQLLIISILFTVQLGLLYAGLSRTNASRATLLINLQPFFVLFLAHCFIPGDQITKRKILGLFMGFTGMAMVFMGRKGVTTDIQTGDLMILMTAFVWACNTVYTKKIINAFDPFQIVLYPDGKIMIQYKALTNDAPSAIGIENRSGTLGISCGRPDDYLSGSTPRLVTLLFTPPATWF